MNPKRFGQLVNLPEHEEFKQKKEESGSAIPENQNVLANRLSRSSIVMKKRDIAREPELSLG